MTFGFHIQVGTDILFSEFLLEYLLTDLMKKNNQKYKNKVKDMKTLNASLHVLGSV